MIARLIFNDMTKMKLESLANELFLDLFEFVTTIDLLRAFRGLNNRFDTLLFTHFRGYHLDFESMSKHDFDEMCQEYFESIAGRTISLRLSNDDATPQQIEHFFSYGITLDKMTHLRALSVCYIRSVELAKRMAFEWQSLTNLIQLNISQCDVLFEKEDDTLSFVNSIWSLPQLLYCNLDVNFQSADNFPVPTRTSSSLCNLSIRHVSLNLSDFVVLLACTARLRYLDVILDLGSDDVKFESDVSLISSLKVYFVTTEPQTIRNLLQNMFNLRRLTIEIDGVCITGYHWEEILGECLPRLQVFRLKMQFELGDVDQGEQQLDELLNSFRSRFWLEEHRWFVRCDWNLAETYNFISVYTVPYPFGDFVLEYVLVSKSTCPQNVDHCSSRRVRRLHCGASFAEDILLQQIRFPDLRHLSVGFPISDNFWAVIPKCDRLQTLNVSMCYGDDAQAQLQALLDRATNLHTLTIDLWLSIDTPLVQNTSVSIHRLDLQGYCRWFTEEQCAALIHSPLGVQCRVLAINVENCSSVLDFVDQMVNLRAFKVGCQDDNWDNRSLSYQTDEFLIWLQRCLPSTCCITRDSLHLHNIRIWIR